MTPRTWLASEVAPGLLVTEIENGQRSASQHHVTAPACRDAASEHRHGHQEGAKHVASVATMNKAINAGGGPWVNRSVAWLASTENTSAPMRPRKTPKSMPVIPMSTTPTSHNRPPFRGARVHPG